MDLEASRSEWLKPCCLHVVSFPALDYAMLSAFCSPTCLCGKSYLFGCDRRQALSKAIDLQPMRVTTGSAEHLFSRYGTSWMLSASRDSKILKRHVLKYYKTAARGQLSLR